jgi:hypothetical protein
MCVIIIEPKLYLNQSPQIRSYDSKLSWPKEFYFRFFYFKFAIGLLSCYLIDFNCSSIIFICSIPIIYWYKKTVLLKNQTINSLRVRQEAFKPWFLIINARFLQMIICRWHFFNELIWSSIKTFIRFKYNNWFMIGGAN